MHPSRTADVVERAPVAAGLVLLLLLAAELAADTQTLARVGDASLDAATFRARALSLAPSEWRALGRDWAERRRRLLDDVLIPDALLSRAASSEATSAGRDALLARALLAAVAEDAARIAPGSAELAADAATNRREFETPRRLALWRILLPTEAAARAAIARLTPPLSAAFKQLAREQSIDTATYMRGGNLGLVAADGQTQMPELRVAPALFEAADRVRDGELVPEPVREGEAFAVVWRRASQSASTLDRAAAERASTARIADERRARAQAELIARLRREHVGEQHPERLLGYAPAFTEEAYRAALPAPGAEALTPARPRPVPTDRGLR
jgi:peptidyl-prolyl cis-trans isomerase C